MYKNNIMEFSMSLGNDRSVVMNNFASQILHIQTPEDRLRAFIGNSMLLVSFFKPENDECKKSLHQLFHLLNVLMQDVETVQWTHPMDESEGSKKIYEKLSDKGDTEEEDTEEEEASGEVSDKEEYKDDYATTHTDVSSCSEDEDPEDYDFENDNQNGNENDNQNGNGKKEVLNDDDDIVPNQFTKQFTKQIDEY